MLIAVFLQRHCAYAQTIQPNIQKLENNPLSEPSSFKKADISNRDTSSRQHPINFELANRNKQSPIIIFPMQIRQDNTVIGTYAIADSNWMGKIVKIFTFYLPDGTKAAEAIIIGISKDNCSLQTLKDNTIHQVEVKAIDNTSRARVLAQYLVDNEYI
jgi:hypothetical protein